MSSTSLSNSFCGMRGELKDQGLAALLKRLAANSKALCVVTTRTSISDLRAYWRTTAPETKLLRLFNEFGVAAPVARS
jgi:hypothetical protein